MSTLLTVWARLSLGNEGFGAGRFAIFRKGALPFADGILKGVHSVAQITIETLIGKPMA